MKATARQRERFESILLAYVRALGPELVLPPDLLARVRAEVPGTTAEEIRAAVRWSLQRSKRKEAAIERAARAGVRTIPARATGKARGEIVNITREDIGVMVGGQIRHALTEAREAGVSDATVGACLRALPAIERKIASLCFVAAYGPVLESPQAMIPLCVLANSRGNCLAASVIVAGPFEYSEEEWAQNMAKRDTRAAAWHELDEAIQRKDARTAMACVTVLNGPSGWDKLMAAVQYKADLGLQPVLWVTVGAFGKKAGGALGVVALPQAINVVLQEMGER